MKAKINLNKFLERTKGDNVLIDVILEITNYENQEIEVSKLTHPKINDIYIFNGIPLEESELIFIG